MAEMQPAERIDVLAVEGEALISAVREGPTSSPIAACPGWDLTELAGHIGTTWRWSGTIVAERRTSPAGIDPVPDLTSQELIGWLDSGLAGVIDAFRGCPPDEPVWGFGLQPRTAAFWQRRLAMETAVHRVDAELAIGRPAAVSADVADDGIGEFVDVLLGRLYRGKEPPAGQLQVQATDTGGSWSTGDAAGGVATISGTAEDLFLVLWNRREIGAVESDGDPSVLKGWRDLGGM